MQSIGPTPQGSQAGEIQLFEYSPSPFPSATPDWQGWQDAGELGSSEDRFHEPLKTVREATTGADFERLLAEETRKSFQAGLERGNQEGRQAERVAKAAAAKAAEEQRVRRDAALVESFAQQRDRYLHSVEQEVVRLALAIAARILRREAQMDPLLLSGAVRVALGQLSGSTEVRLHVPSGELGLWTDAIALLPNLALKVSLIPGEGMRLGDCLVETSLGSVDLGIRSQLAEIERGFFDRVGSASPGAVTEPLSQLTAPAGEAR